MQRTHQIQSSATHATLNLQKWMTDPQALTRQYLPDGCVYYPDLDVLAYHGELNAHDAQLLLNLIQNPDSATLNKDGKLDNAD